MQSRGVRGAITLDGNTSEEIKKGVIELLGKMLEDNNIDTKDIAFAIFTVTQDIDADFPAKFARLNCGFSNVPMMCYNELNVPFGLKKCLRVLLNINTDKNQDEIKHIYLRGAKTLREDINNGSSK